MELDLSVDVQCSLLTFLPSDWIAWFLIDSNCWVGGLIINFLFP